MLAVPAALVRQALDWPLRLAPLPYHGNGNGAIIGVFMHQQQPVPLIDLARWVDTGASAGDAAAAAAAASTVAAQTSMQTAAAASASVTALAAVATLAASPRPYRRVLVLREGGNTVAVGVDRVRGMQTVGAGAVSRVAHHDDPSQLFHSVARCAGIDVPVNLLDVTRLMALAKIWSAEPGCSDADTRSSGKCNGDADGSAAAGDAGAVVSAGSAGKATAVFATVTDALAEPVAGVAGDASAAEDSAAPADWFAAADSAVTANSRIAADSVAAAPAVMAQHLLARPDGVDGAIAAAPSMSVGRGAVRAYGVIRMAACRIGIPIDELAEVLAAPPLQPLFSPRTQGSCSWRGRHVAVTTLQRCLPMLAERAAAMTARRASPGMAAAATSAGPAAAIAMAALASTPPLLAIIQRHGLALGLLIDHVPLIVQVETPATTPPLTMVADADGEPLHLLDLGWLFARLPEAAISGIAAPVHVPATDHGASDRANTSGHLVFEADGLACTALDSIEAVLRLPVLSDGASHLPWRGTVLALHDLRRATAGAGSGSAGVGGSLVRGGSGATGGVGSKGGKGDMDDSGAAAVIVVRGAQGLLGVVVSAVRSMVQAGAGSISRLAVAGRGEVELLTTGSGAAQVSYQRLDLPALAQLPAVLQHGTAEAEPTLHR